MNIDVYLAGEADVEVGEKTVDEKTYIGICFWLGPDRKEGSMTVWATSGNMRNLVDLLMLTLTKSPRQ